MKKTRKFFLTLMVACIVIAPLSLFGGSQAEKGSTSVIPKQTVELTVYTQLANYSGKQVGWFGQIMKEKFNVALNIINEGDGVFTTRMASGDLGDIVVFGNDGDEYKQAYTAGLLWDWNDESLLDNYGKYIKANMGKALEKNAGISGGKIYGFGHDVATSAGDYQSFFYHPDIRWDLYAKLGYPKINTLEDYIGVLEAMVKINPTSETGGKVYGVSLFRDWDGDMVMFVKSTMALYGYDEFGFGLYDTKTDTYQHLFADNSVYLRSLKFYNTLYQKGLVDPDSVTQNYDMHIEKYQKGAALFVIFDWMGSGTYNSEAHLAEGKAMLPCPANDAKTLTYGLNVYGSNRIWTIGAKTQYPELCMTIINWLCTPEGNMISKYGPKGVTWDYNKDGYAYLTTLGKSCQADPNATQMSGGYSGTFQDGTNKINNSTWSNDATNPEGKGETYNYQKWSTEADTDVEPIIQDWRKYTGYSDYDDYIESKGYSVAPGTTYSTQPKSDELQTTWNQVAETIRTYSWQAVYAASNAEFDKIVAEMKEKAMAYGYEKCRAFMENEGRIRASLAKAAKGM